MVKNIIDLFEQGALKKCPEKVAYKDSNGSVTFSELHNKSQRLASYILDKSIIKNKPIAVLIPKSIYSLVAFHGITYSGNTYVPIDSSQPKSRIENIIKVLNPEFIVVNDTTSKIIEDIYKKENIIRIEEAINYSIELDKLTNVKKSIISTDPLYIIFTSGSTGIPKGVVISHQAVINYIEWIQKTFNFTSNDILGNQVPFYFDVSVTDIYVTLKTACSLYIIPESLFAFPAKILKELEENNVTTIFWVPSVLISIANSGLLEKFNYTKLNKILFAGEVMPNKQLNIWRKHIPNALYANLYGPTETTVISLYYIVERNFSDDQPLPIGIPCSNTDVIILNEENKVVTGREIGEICVRGISLSMGYYNNPEKTVDVFVQNPINPYYNELIYRTGDLGHYNEYNEVMYDGRKDFQIKHNGYRIELGEIETATMSINEIKNVCVLYDLFAKQIVLIYSSDKELEIKYIREELLKKISKYALPARIIYLQELPLTPNGKIDRQLLKQTYIGA